MNSILMAVITATCILVGVFFGAMWEHKRTQPQITEKIDRDAKRAKKKLDKDLENDVNEVRKHIISCVAI